MFDEYGFFEIIDDKIFITWDEDIESFQVKREDCGHIIVLDNNKLIKVGRQIIQHVYPKSEAGKCADFWGNLPKTAEQGELRTIGYISSPMVVRFVLNPKTNDGVWVYQYTIDKPMII